jgi:hypothetical protein
MRSKVRGFDGRLVKKSMCWSVEKYRMLVRWDFRNLKELSS